MRRYIFAALIARTDVDFIALEKGEITLRAVVDQLIQTMEEYANYGFAYIEDRLINDPNYYFRDIAFLSEITDMLKSPEPQKNDAADNDVPDSLD